MFPILQVCAGKQTELEISLPEDLMIFAHAVNNGDLSGRADLTVMTSGEPLTAAQVAQIRDVVLSKSTVPAQNITVVEVK